MPILIWRDKSLIMYRRKNLKALDNSPFLSMYIKSLHGTILIV
ncbi:hypothetical protein HMPREF9103_02373 [Lentilactobacillus parafarraginis F0439]|uniref:Uncharacterized protein n=1 Tax=Lentilactobacillus parafarraginis F0439 TaxID=797515 RepID=G9ZRL2_9LACO|nr:hypothetical protein HMPREF9103_02373 [Lentilactobacillus parafarraginis F0439]